MSRVSVNQVHKIYEGNVHAVKGVTFNCEDGEFLAILGPSGSGKSSMLRMIAGLEEITEGAILFDGRAVNDLNPSQRNVALAFESYALFPLMTVYENIAFPLRAQNLCSGAEVDRRVRQIAETLDVTDILNRKPSALSGGHQQRVSLARALIAKPRVTLLDEPISHMDQRVRAEMRARIRRLHDELQLTTIFVTHDQAEAVSLCDRLVVMHLGELQQIGTVDEIWNHPANRFVATFVGEPQMNFLKGKVETPREVSIGTKEGKKIVQLDRTVDQPYVGAEIAVGVRPQQVKLSRTKEVDASVPGSVELMEFQGEKIIYTVRLEDIDGTEVKVATLGEKICTGGERVWVAFRPEAIHLFDKETAIPRC